MLKYICKCGNKKELSKATLKVVDGSVRTAEAKCTCGKYMQEYAKNFRGFPNIKRTESTLYKN